MSRWTLSSPRRSGATSTRFAPAANTASVDLPWPGRPPALRTTATGTRAYVRLTAIGDCARHPDRPSWTRLLAETLASAHDLSVCDLSAPDALADEVRLRQLEDAVAHRPQVAALAIGLADLAAASRGVAEWDGAEVRRHLLDCADQLAWTGATLLTHRLPRPVLLRGPLGHSLGHSAGHLERLEELNAAHDEVHQLYSSFHVDLERESLTDRRAFWAGLRPQPSARGSRLLALRFGELLSPGLGGTGCAPIQGRHSGGPR